MAPGSAFLAQPVAQTIPLLGSPHLLQLRRCAVPASRNPKLLAAVPPVNQRGREAARWRMGSPEHLLNSFPARQRPPCLLRQQAGPLLSWGRREPAEPAGRAGEFGEPLAKSGQGLDCWVVGVCVGEEELSSKQCTGASGVRAVCSARNVLAFGGLSPNGSA